MNYKVARFGSLPVIAILLAASIGYGSIITSAVYERTDGDGAITLVIWCFI